MDLFLPQKEENYRYFLQCKCKETKKAKWITHQECDDKEHAGVLMKHDNSIVNSPWGANFYWQVLEIKTLTKIVSKKTIFKN